MGKEPTKIYLNQMTRLKIYRLFGIRKVSKIEALNNWLSDLPELTNEEKIIANLYQQRLLENIDDWNEQELSLGFIGPIINLINFKVPYQLNFFAQRPISGIIGDYELIGKPDGIIASGSSEPETPYFNFQEYKKDIDSSGDPAGQNLAAMLVGQQQNKETDLVYGCYIVGRYWYFMALKGKEFAISKDFSATHDDDILNIVRILKKLRSILFKQLNIKQ